MSIRPLPGKILQLKNRIKYSGFTSVISDTELNSIIDQAIYVFSGVFPLEKIVTLSFSNESSKAFTDQVLSIRGVYEGLEAYEVFQDPEIYEKSRSLDAIRSQFCLLYNSVLYVPTARTTSVISYVGVAHTVRGSGGDFTLTVKDVYLPLILDIATLISLQKYMTIVMTDETQLPAFDLDQVRKAAAEYRKNLNWFYERQYSNFGSYTGFRPNIFPA
jgi:hypothetical protein